MAPAAPDPAPTPPAYAADARELDRLIVANYAYAERLPGGVLPDSPMLVARRAAVRDRSSLLHYAEDRLTTLADHHAITGASFRDSWAVVPSYSDLWLDGAGVIEAVRVGSPAATAGIVAGDRVVAVGDVAIADAVARFWSDLGLSVTPDRAGYAARVLTAGRRDRSRVLTVARGGDGRVVTLASLYRDEPARPPVTVVREGRGATIRIDNSLGDLAAIAAFDAAMAGLEAGAPVTIDLTNTPSGGNTVVARAILGWFVTEPRAYQRHDLSAEGRETGIARRWVEYVLPRPGKHHRGRVTVLVGRWTGSMGEGLAIGFAELGARVRGDRMAGLLGAIYDYTLPASGLVVKFPVERLSTVSGVPREAFAPR